MPSVSLVPHAPAQASRARVTETPSSLVGLVVVRGGGVPMTQWRLPRRVTATVGNRERHALRLPASWAPSELVTLSGVEDGWLALNISRLPMLVESDWIQGGSATFRPGAAVMLQRGEHRLLWPRLDHPVGVSVSVRTRRLEDQKVAYTVDSVVDTHATGLQSVMGVTDAPMSASLRYRLAVLFRHLIEGEPEPPHVVAKRAEFLRLTEEALVDLAHRYRRRLNGVSGADLQSLLELGEFLVQHPEGLGPADLDP